MADIKIEKKGSSLWWLWLLIALVVIGMLLWLFLGNNHRDTTTAQAPVVATAPMQPAGDANMTSVEGTADGPITDLATVIGSNDGSLVGRDVRLSSVPVGDVVGDASFWLTGADGKRVYVVLDEVRTPGTPIEGRVDVDKGNNVDLVGTIRSASNGAPEGAATGTQTDPLPAGVTQYIYAQSAKVVR